MALMEIQGLTHRFGGLQAVTDFSLSLGEREIIGLIGPNGAGKTTIFNLVSGFYPPMGGTITFQGNAIQGLKPHQVAGRGIARTFQNIRLWGDMTVLDNIRLAHTYGLGYGFFGAIWRSKRYFKEEKLIEENSRELLDIMGLSDVTDEFAKNLPYGSQRRVELARALTSKPKLLLLDEPAAGLNSSDVEDLIKLIQWIHSEFDICVWMIEHQMKVVMSLCQKISVLDFGRVIASGTPDQIQSDPDVIKAYLGDSSL
ncbi:MAG: ABC transporter ATP-binding protein [Deltaproteobacteria bacterium]|nr:ABC transporter ATP-binding protein [Deltaproteobacteria bacterium]